MKHKIVLASLLNKNSALALKKHIEQEHNIQPEIVYNEIDDTLVSLEYTSKHLDVFYDINCSVSSFLGYGKPLPYELQGK